MNPEEVVSIIKEVAKLLEPGTQQAWEIALRRVATGAWMATGFGIFCFALSIGLLYAGYRWGWQKVNGWQERNGDVYTFCWIGSGAAFFFSVAFLANGIMQLLNLQWYAIQLLLGLISQ